MGVRILCRARAGSMQSCDCLVEVGPRSDAVGVDIAIQSTVGKAFGAWIKAVVQRELQNLGVDAGMVRIRDCGALDYVIRARLETAVRRAIMSSEAECHI